MGSHRVQLCFTCCIMKTTRCPNQSSVDAGFTPFPYPCSCYVFFRNSVSMFRSTPRERRVHVRATFHRFLLAMFMSTPCLPKNFVSLPNPWSLRRHGHRCPFSVCPRPPNSDLYLRLLRSKCCIQSDLLGHKNVINLFGIGYSIKPHNMVHNLWTIRYHKKHIQWTKSYDYMVHAAMLIKPNLCFITCLKIHSNI